MTLDDATTTIYSAFLVDEEDTTSSFAGVSEVIPEFGLFNSLYTDRGSHYQTPKPAANSTGTAPPSSDGPWASSASR